MSGVQETSKLAYFNKILPNLTGQKREICDLILRTGSMTNKEISEMLGLEINSTTPRVNQLVKKGVLEEKGRRPCRITGNLAIEWGIKDMEAVKTIYIP